jgi:DNA polymerase
MLREMGVHVWQPAEPDALVPAAFAMQNEAVSADSTGATRQNRSQVSTAPVVAESPDQALLPAQSVRPKAAGTERFSVLPPTPQVASALPAGLPPLTWTELQQTVAACQACAMCEGRRAPVLAAPAEALPCDWMIVGEPPDELQERLAYPFAGEAGQLLDRMLRAVGAQRFPATTTGVTEVLGPASARAYLTHVLKCRPARVRAPVAAELAACAGYLRREIALVQPKVIVTMGRFAMQLLLSEMPPEQVKLPLGKLRGRVWQFAGVPVVVTYPPDYLLSNAPDKAKAWADLQLAMAVVRGEVPAAP